MLTVKIKLVNGFTEMFETNRFSMGTAKNMPPDYMDVKVYAECGKLLKHVSRKFKFIYRHVTYKSEKVQEAVREYKKAAESAGKAN